MGQLAEFALANLADGWALCGEVRKTFETKGFGRFKDDVLVVLIYSFPQVPAWCGFYKRRAESIFEMDVEGVSRDSVETLALVLRVGAGRIETSPRVKPTSAVFSLSSGHQPA